MESMAHFALFLRGINVGKIRFSMADLKSCLEKSGLINVKTYLQSGNVTCQFDGSATELKSIAEQTLTARFNYEAYVHVVTHAELEDIVHNYPWEETPPDTHRYALLCSDPVLQSEILEFAKTKIESEEKVASHKNVIFWQVPRGLTLSSEFGKFTSKAKFKSNTTNRNLNTLEKMLK